MDNSLTLSEAIELIKKKSFGRPVMSITVWHNILYASYYDNTYLHYEDRREIGYIGTNDLIAMLTIKELEVEL